MVTFKDLPAVFAHSHYGTAHMMWHADHTDDLTLFKSLNFQPCVLTLKYPASWCCNVTEPTPVDVVVCNTAASGQHRFKV